MKRTVLLPSIALLFAACGAVNTVPGVTPDGGLADATADAADVPADAARDAGPADVDADAGDGIPYYNGRYDIGTPGDDLETPTDVNGDPAPAGSVPSCVGYPNNVFPAITPGKKCAFPAPAGQVCLEEGWVCTFHRDRNYVPAAGETAHWDSADVVANAPPACMLQTSNVGSISPVFVRGFRMDIHEFTNGDLMALLASLPPADAAKIPVPPERVGFPEKQEVQILSDTEERVYWPDQPARTGWFGRTFHPLQGYMAFPAIQYRSPVIGLSKTDASAICKARGGRLPLVDEYQRASRGLAPNARLFPWGDEIPSNNTCPTGNPDWFAFCGNAGVYPVPQNGVHTITPVAHVPSKYGEGSERTPGGVRGLMGGVAEWTGSAPPTFNDPYFGREPSVYVAPPERTGAGGTSTVELSVGSRGARFSHLQNRSDYGDLYHGFRCVFDL